MSNEFAAHLIRPVRIGGKVQKEIYGITDEIKIGSSDLASVKIHNIEPVHLVISPIKDDRHMITQVLGLTYINGTELDIGSCDRILNHKDCIALGHRLRGEVLVYKNEILGQLQEDSTNISSIVDANVHFGFRVPQKISKLNTEFFMNCPSGSKLEFAKHAIEFIFQHFPIARAAFYDVSPDGTKAIPIHARAPERFFKPPQTLLRRLQREKQSILFNAKEELPENKSLSIVQQKITQAFIFPLVSDDALIGLLYLDTLEGKVPLSQDDFMIISSLIPGISACLKCIYFAEMELRRNEIIVKTLISSLMPPQNQDVRYRGMSSDNYLLFYESGTNGRDLTICDMAANFSTKLALAIYLRNIMRYEHNRNDFAIDSIIDFANNLPSNIKPDKLDVAIISIDNEKKIYAAQNYSTKFIAAQILTYGDCKKLLEPDDETMTMTATAEGTTGEWILIIPPSQDAKAIEELNRLDLESRTDANLIKTIEECCGEYILLRV